MSLLQVKTACNKIFVYSILEVPDNDACGISRILIVTSSLLSVISGVNSILLAGAIPIQ